MIISFTTFVSITLAGLDNQMTKSELMKFAHAEARKLRLPYRQAMAMGLRRAHNKAMHLQLAAMHRIEEVKFMWLRGM